MGKKHKEQKPVNAKRAFKNSARYKEGSGGSEYAKKVEERSRRPTESFESAAHNSRGRETYSFSDSRPSDGFGRSARKFEW